MVLQIYLQRNSISVYFNKLRGQFSPVLIDTSFDHVNLLNQVKGGHPRCGTID